MDLITKYVRHADVAKWEAEGWHNAGPLPGHHAYWSVAMVKNLHLPNGNDRAQNATSTAAPAVMVRHAMHDLPDDRKQMPVASGLLGYFPDACNYVAYVSKTGNDQHNPGKEMFWRRGASTDHGDCLVRHQVEFDKLDTDNLLHAGKVAWRALAQLQMLLEARRLGYPYQEYIGIVQRTEG